MARKQACCFGQYGQSVSQTTIHSISVKDSPATLLVAIQPKLDRKESPIDLLDIATPNTIIIIT